MFGKDGKTSELQKSAVSHRIQSDDDEEGVGNQYLSHDHRKRTLDNYRKLQEGSITVPMQKLGVKDTNRMAKKARYRFE
jgi:hypothetical protein